jgi:hypothetical protein
MIGMKLQLLLNVGTHLPGEKELAVPWWTA